MQLVFSIGSVKDDRIFVYWMALIGGKTLQIVFLTPNCGPYAEKACLDPCFVSGISPIPCTRWINWLGQSQSWVSRFVDEAWNFEDFLSLGKVRYFFPFVIYASNIRYSKWARGWSREKIKRIIPPQRLCLDRFLNFMTWKFKLKFDYSNSGHSLLVWRPQQWVFRHARVCSQWIDLSTMRSNLPKCVRMFGIVDSTAQVTWPRGGSASSHSAPIPKDLHALTPNTENASRHSHTNIRNYLKAHNG